MSDKKDVEIEKSIDGENTESRRAFLKKAGLVALYTPPAMAVLMSPSQASMMKSPGGQYGNHGHPAGHDHPHTRPMPPKPPGQLPR